MVSSSLFHDTARWESVRFTYESRPLSFFRNSNEGLVNEEVLAEILDPSFMRALAEEGIEWVIVHPRHLDFLTGRGLVHPSTWDFYGRIEEQWRSEGRLVFQDESIRAYRTGDRTRGAEEVDRVDEVD